MKYCMTQAAGHPSRRGWASACAWLIGIHLSLLFGGPAEAATLYWDTDGSTTGNLAATGANLGGSGVWGASEL